MDKSKNIDLPESGVPDDANIEEFIEILNEHWLQCEQQGKYVEAEMAKNRITELKLKLKQDTID